ncbi:MAG: glycoside hydrolase family 3 N-terminal domain-containing protein [Gemmatimonadaceae bacterium]|nr:glycoside hydrolase family 3 N-terminal domain-containing protein [Gemmatimonadaceae bacterium]
MMGRHPLALLLVLGACAPVVAPPTRHDAASDRIIGTAHPGATTPLSQQDSAWVEATLLSLSPRERVAQLVMPWVPGEYSAVGSPEYEQVRGWVQDDKVGGLVLSIGLPHSYAAKLNHMQRLAAVPLLVTSDMENGTGMRLGGSYALPSLLPQGGGTVFPPVMALGATRSEELAYRLGEVLGAEARAVGVHMTFGPVLDVNANPLNPIINTRSFGEDPKLVSRLADAYIRGARDEGLMTTGKHFPGHGDTDIDSHLNLPTIRADRARLDAVDLPPFRSAVTTGIDAIMTAHIAVTGILGDSAPPATLSPYFMTDVLRKEMGFSGLLVTDAMTMGGVANRYGATEPLVLALQAGADILLMPRNIREAIDVVMSAIQSGRLTQSRIDVSVRRLLRVKAQAGLRAGRLVNLDAIDTIVNVPAKSAVATEVAEKSITLARDERSLVPLPRAGKRLLSITYADASDIVAGRVFNQELRRGGFSVAVVGVDGRTTPAEFDALRARADSADVIVASAYVFPRAGRGSIGAEGGFPALIEQLATAKKNVVAVSFGSPYLVSAYPSVPAYLLAWGGAPVSQRAAVAALLGEIGISGRLPISIPPWFQSGAGLDRSPVTPTSK